MTQQVIAYHVILTCYGFWLPNDERGSGSDHVWADHLRPFEDGTASRADGERSVAHRTFDRQRARAARDALKYPVVYLTGDQAQLIGRAIGEMALRDQLSFLAFAILPQHLHCVVARHPRFSVEQIMSRMKAASTQALLTAGLHPFARFARPGRLLPKLFARGGRHRFLFTPDDVLRRIRYVEQNPLSSKLPRQRWHFVAPYVAPHSAEPRTQ